MGCTTCTNKKDGIPNGCNSNGSCSSGGCERMAVFNWLSDIEVPVGRKKFDCVEVSFKNGRKDFFRNLKNVNIYTGDVIVVEGNPGYDVGVITLAGELVKHQMNRKGVNSESSDIKKVYRKATQEDIDKWQEARKLESVTLQETRTFATKLGLQMKLGDVEYQGDKGKAVFYYTADERVDFRELIKLMADKFKIRIEMRQIGARQEAGRIGGIGACGRELCCSTWLSDFRSVSTGAARYQQLSLNPQKLAGQCGKLKCCLNYELDQYVDALKKFPNTKTVLDTRGGRAVHIKTDVFKEMMWYLVQKEKGQNSIVPLTISRVHEIIELNKGGKKPDDLNDFAFVEEVKAEPDYSNVVGQDELTRFDKVFTKKKKKKKRSGSSQNRSGQKGKGAGNQEKRQGKGPQNKNQNQPNKGQNTSKNRKPRNKNQNKNTGGHGNKPQNKPQNKRQNTNQNKKND